MSRVYPMLKADNMRYTGHNAMLPEQESYITWDIVDEDGNIIVEALVTPSNGFEEESVEVIKAYEESL